MTQLELFRDEPLPPTSCRKFWDRPTQNNQFSVGWERDEIDFDALAHQMTLFLRRAAKKGDGWAISCLVEQAEQLADDIARRDPRFDIATFCQLLEMQRIKLKAGLAK